jgi:hypothetical protein
MTSKKTRPRTFIELQPYMFTYGGFISTVSPLASLYQLIRLNSQVQITMGRMLYMSGIVFVPQTVLKAIQMNISTPVRKSINPWAAFWVIGVLQGGVYGQANIYFSKTLGLVKKANYANLFRGFLFGGFRDVVSQVWIWVYCFILFHPYMYIGCPIRMFRLGSRKHC